MKLRCARKGALVVHVMCAWLNGRWSCAPEEEHYGGRGGCCGEVGEEIGVWVLSRWCVATALQVSS
jgi:hypothetical protein